MKVTTFFVPNETVHQQDPAKRSLKKQRLIQLTLMVSLKRLQHHLKIRLYDSVKTSKIKNCLV